MSNEPNKPIEAQELTDKEMEAVAGAVVVRWMAGVSRPPFRAMNP